MNEPLITGTDFVAVATRDIEGARAFYGGVLGLRESSLWQRPGDDRVGIEFETGNLTLALVHSEALGLEFRPSGHPIALRVADVARVRAELERRGVVFEGETIDSGVCHQAIFRDPDGNVLDLHHRYAPRV